MDWAMNHAFSVGSGRARYKASVEYGRIVHTRLMLGAPDVHSEPANRRDDMTSIDIFDASRDLLCNLGKLPGNEWSARNPVIWRRL
jgi:hypothetical protein